MKLDIHHHKEKEKEKEDEEPIAMGFIGWLMFLGVLIFLGLILLIVVFVVAPFLIGFLVGIYDSGIHSKVWDFAHDLAHRLL